MWDGSRVDDGVGGAEYQCEALPFQKQAEWMAEEEKRKKKEKKSGGWEVCVCRPEPAVEPHFRGEHAVPSSESGSVRSFGVSHRMIKAINLADSAV